MIFFYLDSSFFFLFFEFYFHNLPSWSEACCSYFSNLYFRQHEAVLYSSSSDHYSAFMHVLKTRQYSSIEPNCYWNLTTIVPIFRKKSCHITKIYSKVKSVYNTFKIPRTLDTSCLIIFFLRYYHHFFFKHLIVITIWNLDNVQKQIYIYI